MVDFVRIKGDLFKIKTEKEKLEHFNNLVKQMDKDEENNNRKHNKHRADFDISILEVGTNRENKYIPLEITKVYLKLIYHNYSKRQLNK